MSRALLHRILVRDHASALASDVAKPISTSRVFCSGCFEKQRDIDLLKAEVVRLKSELGRKRRKTGVFGIDAHMPSSRHDAKPQAHDDDRKKRGGSKSMLGGAVNESTIIASLHRLSRLF